MHNAAAAANRHLPSNMFAVNTIITCCPPVRPQNGTRLTSAPHPSEGGSRGYAQEMRDQVISLWMNGEDLNAMWIELLQHQKKFPCVQTCRRWIRLHQGEGHSRRRRPTGNHFSDREVHGQDLINLAVYRTVRPKAYINEVRAYVHNCNPANMPYS